MATGKFRLYFTHEHTQHAAAGVQYRLTNQESGQYFSFGTTDAHGETKPVETTHEVSTCSLEVLNAMTGNYEAPDRDGAVGASPCPTLKLAGATDKGSVLESVRVKPYFLVRFHTQHGNKPISGAKYTAYQLDANGKEAVARDLDRSAPITGLTNAKGETGVVYCAAPLVFKFEIPGTSVKVSTKRLDPLLKGQKLVRYDMPFKVVAASTVPQTQDAVQQLAGKLSLPLIVSPADDEIIAVPQSAFDEFE